MEVNLRKKLRAIPYFTTETLRSLTDLKEASLRQKIRRNIKSGSFIPLKRGYYTTGEFFTKYRLDPSFQEFIANVLRKPSYLSTTYVLSINEVLTELSFGITSLTTKSTRAYSNKINNFQYQNIKKSLFSGYHEKYFLDNSYFIASKQKALFDYLYLKSPIISVKNKTNLVEELRLNMDNFTNKELTEFEEFANTSNSKKIISICKNIASNAHSHL